MFQLHFWKVICNRYINNQGKFIFYRVCIFVHTLHYHLIKTNINMVLLIKRCHTIIWVITKTVISYHLNYDIEGTTFKTSFPYLPHILPLTLKQRSSHSYPIVCLTFVQYLQWVGCLPNLFHHPARKMYQISASSPNETLGYRI